MNTWSVRKRKGRWVVYEDACAYDIFDSLPEAHDWATLQTIIEMLSCPGGLARVADLLRSDFSAEYRMDGPEIAVRYVTPWLPTGLGVHRFPRGKVSS